MNHDLITKSTNKMEKTVRGFAIYFLARSGSTYLIHQLRNHPDVVARAEVFGASTLPDDLPQTSDNQIAFLRRFWRTYHTEKGTNSNTISRGFKVQLSSESPQIINFNRYRKVSAEYDVCHFFLYRKNRVKQLVSSYRALQLKEFTLNQSGRASAHVYSENVELQNANFSKIVIPPEEFKQRLNKLEANVRLLEDAKSKFEPNYVLYYEDMVQNKDAFFERFFDIIGLEASKLSQEDKVVKATSDNLVEVIENFDEISRILKGTLFEDQLLECAQ